MVRTPKSFLVTTPRPSPIWRWIGCSNIHNPPGEGTPDKHLAELYDLTKDPKEDHNLAQDPAFAETKSKLAKQLGDLLVAEGLTPEKDQIPSDEGIKTELPDQKIR